MTQNISTTELGELGAVVYMASIASELSSGAIIVLCVGLVAYFVYKAVSNQDITLGSSCCTRVDRHVDTHVQVSTPEVSPESPLSSESVCGSYEGCSGIGRNFHLE